VSVRFAGVSFRYPGADEDALRNVTLAFQPGEVTLLTGTSGAGCSTLLLTAAGLAPHVTGGTRTGEVDTLGVDPMTDSGRQALAGRIGVLLATPWTQLSGMAYTVHDEVAFGPANLGWDREEIRAHVHESMKVAGVSHLAQRDPRTLSGGELQRVMFAGVMAMAPDLYLLDEPAAELDPAAAGDLYAMLSTLALDRAVVVASTDVDRLAEVVDRVVELEHGAVVADGPPAVVLGAAAAVERGTAPTVAVIAHRAGVPPDYPTSVAMAARRWSA
jgi:energy-coupling factor transporter ATP-binding protein EcfA2